MILTIDEKDLHFQVFGEGPPLIVLHGWGDSGNSWIRVAQLLQNSFQVFLLDLPGCGYSDPPPRVWSVEDYEQLVIKFLAEMEIAKPIILGHSHGGKIAATYVANQHPAKQLILVSTSGLDSPSFEVRAKVLWFKTMKRALLMCGDWGKAKIEELRNKMGSRDYREAGLMRDTMVKVVNQKLFTTVPRIALPTLILWGSEDKTLDMSQAKIFRKLIPGSVIRILWGSSHHPHLDAPDELAERVLEFCVPATTETAKAA